jgi:hypothetical protein
MDQVLVFVCLQEKRKSKQRGIAIDLTMIRFMFNNPPEAGRPQGNIF